MPGAGNVGGWLALRFGEAAQRDMRTLTQTLAANLTDGINRFEQLVPEILPDFESLCQVEPLDLKALGELAAAPSVHVLPLLTALYHAYLCAAGTAKAQEGVVDGGLKTHARMRTFLGVIHVVDFLQQLEQEPTSGNSSKTKTCKDEVVAANLWDSLPALLKQRLVPA